MMRHGMRARRVAGLALTVALVVGAAACGDDDTSASDTTDTTAAPETTDTTETTAATATTGGDTGGTTSAETSEYCRLAQELYQQDGPPTADQLAQYEEVAPAELQDTVAGIAPSLIDAGDDIIAFFNVIADDDAEAALDEINAVEEEQCGIPHSQEEPDQPADATEPDPDAAQVAVSAVEYDFTFDEPVEAGRTTFTLTADGAQAHFLLLVKLAEGITLEDAMASDDPEAVIEGQWLSGMAAAGGEDEEYLTVDLEPGTYAMLCFVGDENGAHAEQGMAKEFTVV